MDLLFVIEPQEVFEQVSAEILKMFDTNTQITNVDPHTIQAAKDDFRKLICESEYDINRVIHILRNKCWNEDKVDFFVSLVEKKKTELLYSVLLYHQSSYGETVMDFDWLLKLIAGTNNLKAMKYPLLQLMLTTLSSNGEQKQRLFELNKDAIAKLITVLERIN